MVEYAPHALFRTYRVAVKKFKLNYHNSDTMLITIYPHYGHLN